MKFTIRDFRKKFPDDNACLFEVMRLRFGSVSTCPYEHCGKETKFHRVKSRRCFECQWCGYQIYPTKGTIFEKSSTPLQLWFYAIYLMTATRSGVSAKELQRQLGVTYKCAWRMAHEIRKLMGGHATKPLKNRVEIDETYVGGKHAGVRGRGARGKTAVFGMVQRQGNIKAKIVDNVKCTTVLPLIAENVSKKAIISTDEFLTYKPLKKLGYQHKTIEHGAGEYVRGLTHTQTIEGFWSQLKRSISGTHVWVSKKHLQKYVDEFAFRFNQRHVPSEMFSVLLNRLEPPVKVAC